MKKTSKTIKKRGGEQQVLVPIDTRIDSRPLLPNKTTVSTTAKINKPTVSELNKVKNNTLYLKCIDPKKAIKIEINNNCFSIDKLNDIIKNICIKKEFNNNDLPFTLKKTGGASLLSIDNDDQVKQEYSKFTRYIDKLASNSQEKINIEIIIDNLANGRGNLNIVIKDDDNNDITLNQLKNFITGNNHALLNTITFDMGHKYQLMNIDNAVSYGQIEYTLEYRFREYNKNIVEAFQKKFIENHTNIQALINSHITYIDGLSTKNKCTINDYTNPEAYIFYSKYYKSGDADWLNKYKNNSRKKFKFGDAFLPQIYEYHDEYIKPLVADTASAGLDVQTLDNPDYLNINAELNDIQSILKTRRKNINDLSWFHDKLIKEDWEYILEKFEFDLNNIIMNAPVAPSNIHCYRGANKHVIENQRAINNPNISLNCYQTSRITSFSISYRAAQNFYYSNGEKNVDTVERDACLYRTTIMEGANVLFIEPITTCDTEFEIITPSDTVIVDPIGFDLETLTSTTELSTLPAYIHNHEKNIKYNNIDDQTGIYGRHYEKIQSIDIIVVGCPPPAPRQRPRLPPLPRP